MNKWAIPVISVLVVVIVIGGFLLLQEKNTLANNLTEAESKIVTMEGSIVVLNGNISTLQGKLSTSEAEVSSLQGKLTDAQATVKTLQTDLTSANSNIKGLQGDVSAQQKVNSTLSADLRKVQDPRHFASIQELTDWLIKDDTNTKYAKETLQQRAFIQQVRALRDGYLLPAYFEDSDSDYYLDYGGNLAYIGDRLYMVGTDSDLTAVWAIVTPIPSRSASAELAEGIVSQQMGETKNLMAVH